MKPRIVNGWLIEDPFVVEDGPPGDFYAAFRLRRALRGMIATHMLSGVELTWTEAVDDIQISPEPDRRVRLRHPATPDRTRAISAPVDWDGAREVIAGVIGVPVEELRQPRRPSPSENVLKG